MARKLYSLATARLPDGSVPPRDLLYIHTNGPAESVFRRLSKIFSPIGERRSNRHAALVVLSVKTYAHKRTSQKTVAPAPKPVSPNSCGTGVSPVGRWAGRPCHTLVAANGRAVPQMSGMHSKRRRRHYAVPVIDVSRILSGSAKRMNSLGTPHLPGVWDKSRNCSIMSGTSLVVGACLCFARRYPQ